MELTPFIATLVFVLLTIVAGFATISLVIAWKAISLCMWFHASGRAKAQWELEHEALKARQTEAEAVKVKAETEKIRVSRQVEAAVPGSRFGASDGVNRENMPNGRG